MNITLIVGLGNPEKEYENTYHNAGFLAVEFLKNTLNEDEKRAYIWLTPQTGMNRSGKAVLELMKKEAIKPEKLLVIHDDSDLPLGETKLSFGKNSGGHKGVEDIIQKIGTNEFYRFRIGIRPEITEGPRAKALDFVLDNIQKDHRQKLESAFEILLATMRDTSKEELS